ncbi:MAG: molybdopterin-dependent oxidoreductase [Rhodobacteraceae bacterium]|nr:molybdopterin-dependent oxidoreductase [Paracoccaceae bacterium]
MDGIEEHCKSGRRDAHRLMPRDAQRHHAPNACKLFLAQHNGKAFGTVEGIADPGRSLHSEQYAQMDRPGPPCGFYWPSALVSRTTVPANGAVEHDDDLLRRLRHARPDCVFAAQALASLPLGQRSRGADPESDTVTAGDTAAAANNLGPPLPRGAARLHITGPVSDIDDMLVFANFPHLAIAVREMTCPTLKTPDLDALGAALHVVEARAADNLDPDECFGEGPRILARNDSDAAAHRTEDQPREGAPSTACTIIVARTGRSAKLDNDRDDLLPTGRPHDLGIRYHVRTDGAGHPLGSDFVRNAQCGWTLGLTLPVADPAMLLAENGHHVPDARTTSHHLKTSTQSLAATRILALCHGMLGIMQIADPIPPALNKAPLSTRKLKDHREMSALGVGSDSDGQEPPQIVTLNANLASRHAQGGALPEDDQIQGSPGAGQSTRLGMTVEDVILRSITDRMSKADHRADQRIAMGTRFIQKRQTIGEIIHVENGKSHTRTASNCSAESVMQRVEHSGSLGAKGVSVTQRHAWNRGAPRAQLTAGTQIQTSPRSLDRGLGPFRGCAVVLASGFWDASRFPAFGRPRANLRRISGGAKQPVAAGGFEHIACPTNNSPLGKAPDQIAIGVAKRPPSAGPPLRVAMPSRQDTA